MTIFPFPDSKTASAISWGYRSCFCRGCLAGERIFRTGTHLTITYTVHANYLAVKAEGQFAADSARQALDQWIQQATIANLQRVLVDITAVQGLDVDQRSLMLRFKLAVLVAGMLPAGMRLAFLVTARQTPPDHFDETVMVNRGADVKVTTDPNEALIWLGVASDDDRTEATATV